jgi:transposase-like protein
MTVAIDELLKDYPDPQDILGKHGLLKHLMRRVVERALEAEWTAHLGYAPYAHRRQRVATPATARAKRRGSWRRSRAILPCPAIGTTASHPSA